MGTLIKGKNYIQQYHSRDSQVYSCISQITRQAYNLFQDLWNKFLGFFWKVLMKKMVQIFFHQFSQKKCYKWALIKNDIKVQYLYKILTSFGCAQHPEANRNTQQRSMEFKCLIHHILNSAILEYIFWGKTLWKKINNDNWATPKSTPC